MNRSILTLLALGGLLLCCAHAAFALEMQMGLNENAPPSVLPQDSRQLILVTTAGWDINQGTLQRYQRDAADTPWQPVGAALPIGVGHSGLAWGVGLHPKATTTTDPVKYEGDGRAPAGIFELPFAFARAPEEVPDAKMPVVHTNYELVCVDDAASANYNRVITPEQAGGKDWKSAENMLRKDELYRWGVVVAHNYETPVPKRGSCIFLHVRTKPQGVTNGCTAMAPKDMVELLTWLTPQAHPVLVQLPAAEYQRLQKEWGLP